MTSAADAMTLAKQMKEHTVEQAGGPDDIMPMLDVTMTDGSVRVAVLTGGHPTDMIRGGVQALLEGAGKVQAIVVIAESYMLTTTESDWPADGFARGSLAARFEAGDTSVTECVVVHYMDRSGLAEALFAPFHYDGATVVWDESLAPSGDETTGALPSALATAWIELLSHGH